MHICLVGSHGVGKTSLLKELQKYLLNYTLQIESLTRKAVGEDSTKLNFQTNDESEKLIANLYMECFLNAPVNFIVSRGMVDVLAYSLYLNKKNKNIKDSTLEDIRNKIIKIEEDKIFDLVCYIPIEFDLKEGGKYREGQEDKSYQKDVDKYIISILTEYGIPFVTLTGSIEERKNQVLDEMVKWYSK